MPESRFPPIALLLVLIAAFAIYGIILSPNATFAGMDFTNLNFPRVWQTKHALSQGTIPLWNWHEWGGAPLLAALQGAVFYPATWLAVLLPLPYGLQIFVFLHLTLAGIGSMLVARRVFRLPTAASAYAGIAYMGSAFFIGRIEQFQIIAANCLLPYLILTLYNSAFFKSGSRWLALVWALTLLAGHPQFAALNLLGAAGFIFLTGLLGPRRYKSNPTNIRQTALRLFRIGSQIVLGTLLASVQLLPTWELSQLSERIWPYTDPTTPELSWANLPSLMIPHYYNMITGYEGRVYTELGMYAGLLTVPLAVAGITMSILNRSHITGSFRQRRLVWAAAIVWFIAMIFALGKHAGLADLVFEYVPFFKQSRGAARSLNVAALMLSLIAACGLTELINTMARRRKTSLTKPSRPIALAAFGFVLANIIDLSATHKAALKSILVPTAALKSRPLIPSELLKQSQQTGAPVYRFMAFDSDIHLNNTAPVVAERLTRLQPNLSSTLGISLIDGYEEGLLPSRNHANLFRRFNRNLRNTSPDAALLAGMGSNLMLTEYPLAPNNSIWTRVSEPFYRPDIVPSVDPSSPGAYVWWKSSYPASRWYDLEKLTPAHLSAEEFLSQLERDYSLLANERTPTGSALLQHSLGQISPEDFAAASAPYSPKQPDIWNRCTVVVAPATTRTLVLIPPFPGWKLSEKNSDDANIKPLNAISYLIDCDSQNIVPYSLELIYSPFSFHLGLFISLTAALFYLYQSMGYVRPHQSRN